MSRYFSSDWHLNSTLICRYAHRPWQTAEDNICGILAAVKETVKPEDVLMHVGDFCLTSPDRHGTEDDIPLAISPADHMAAVDCRLVLLAGNHDDGHARFEADATSMVIDLNHKHRNVYVSHYPSCHAHWRGRSGTDSRIKVCLCGHVHDSWLLQFDPLHKVLNINVGVDVWDFRPVRDSQVTDLLDYFYANLYHKIAPKPGVWTKLTLTRAALDDFKRSHTAAAAAAREQRKAEKHAKKGLTAEECERRKLEAMRKKGLLKHG